MRTQDHNSKSANEPQLEIACNALMQLPEALRERPQWLFAGPDKSPRLADGSQAKWSDPNTWTTFESASLVAQEKGGHVGYVLTADDPFTCIDLDIKDDTPQERVDQFIALVDYFDSYTEHSRSGKGYHVWVKGKLPKGFNKDGIELYSDKRFIICTGNVVRAKPIVERQEILDTYVGNWTEHYPSQSEADLAFITGLMKTSGLAREKTFKNLSRTVEKAWQVLENDRYHLEHGRQLVKSLMRNWKQRRHFLVMHDKDLLTMPPARWLIKDTVPESGLVTVYGEPKTGKTFLGLDMMAAIAKLSAGPHGSARG